MTENIFEIARAKVDAKMGRSAWSKGVNAYAADLLDDLEAAYKGGYITLEELSTPFEIESAMLNGARNWQEYSWGGCSLCYNHQIAELLCTPSELKKKRGGELPPNRDEEWLDVQARALNQAARLVKSAVLEAVKESN